MLNSKDVLYLLLEMFRRVNVPFESVDLNEEDWYLKYSWTTEQSNSYKDWLVETLRKKHKLSKATANATAGMFLLNYGWTIKD